MIEVKELDPEIIKKLLEETFNHSYTIEEALEEQKMEDENLKMSFNVAWTGYKSISLYRKSYLSALRVSKVKSNFLKLFSLIMNNGTDEVMDLIIKRLNLSINELKDIKKILDEINQALIKLQSNRVGVCNFDICELLAYLGMKMELDSNCLVNDLTGYKLSLKGIGYSNCSKDEDNLKEINKQIDESILKLGLSKQKA